MPRWGRDVDWPGFFSSAPRQREAGHRSVRAGENELPQVHDPPPGRITVRVTCAGPGSGRARVPTERSRTPCRSPCCPPGCGSAEERQTPRESQRALGVPGPGWWSRPARSTLGPHAAAPMDRGRGRLRAAEREGARGGDRTTGDRPTSSSRSRIPCPRSAPLEPRPRARPGAPGRPQAVSRRPRLRRPPRRLADLGGRREEQAAWPCAAWSTRAVGPPASLLVATCRLSCPALGGSPACCGFFEPHEAPGRAL